MSSKSKFTSLLIRRFFVGPIGLEILYLWGVWIAWLLIHYLTSFYIPGVLSWTVLEWEGTRMLFVHRIYFLIWEVDLNFVSWTWSLSLLIVREHLYCIELVNKDLLSISWGWWKYLILIDSRRRLSVNLLWWWLHGFRWHTLMEWHSLGWGIRLVLHLR